MPEKLPLMEAAKGTDRDAASAESCRPMSWEDRMSMCVLLVLYTLQGIPMGLCGSLPLIMKERGVGFESLALFSLVTVPFSLKLLWAPLVDSCYMESMGRRKTWLVPVQLLCGAVMLVGSRSIDDWLGPDPSSTVDVKTLSAFFFFLYFLMATQDISVDGWALTMLSRRNVGYASTCNSIGQSLGFFMANQGFIALSDPVWCGRFLAMDEGKALVTLAQFMRFWGVVFIATTLIIWVFKRESVPGERASLKKARATLATAAAATGAEEGQALVTKQGQERVQEDEFDDEEEVIGLVDTYKQIYQIFQIRAVQLLSIVLLTCKAAFAPADSAHTFKLQEYGMPKADIATVSPVLLGVGLVLPAFLGPYVSRSPLDVFMIGIPLKLCTSLLSWYMFQFANQAYSDGETPGPWFFVPLIFTMILHEAAGTTIFVSQMAFFSKISDPAIGGTYMTMLNTVANLGHKWPNALVLWLLPRLTWETCTEDAAGTTSCTTSLDGYTVETAICITAGVAWLVLVRPILNRLKTLPRGDWLVSANTADNAAKLQ